MTKEEYLKFVELYNSFYEEIKQKAVKEPGTGGTRRLTIPAFTKVTVSDTQLTLLYPIDIRIMPHGGYNITFNTSAISPLARVENNMLEWLERETNLVIKSTI